MPLFDLLIPYKIQQSLLQSLSAYNVAKLNAVLGGFLDRREREVYLNPIQDLIWDTTELRALKAFGMRLLLIGNNTSALQEQVRHLIKYIRNQGHA
jgi:hypothetical protein